MVYSAVDLFVGASKEEAFGQVFTEAAACGSASVGFPVGGIPEALIDGVSGYVAATATADDLAAAIYDLYSHPERRRAMGAWGRMFAENEWSAEMAYHELHVALRRSGISAGEFSAEDTVCAASADGGCAGEFGAASRRVAGGVGV